jgi:hypothetical protein
MPRLALVAAEAVRSRDLEGGGEKRLDGRDEPRLLIVEVAVIAALGDAGELADVGDRGRVVALFGDCRHHRREDPLALAGHRLLLRRGTARPQLSGAELVGISPWRLDHGRDHILVRRCSLSEAAIQEEAGTSVIFLGARCWGP